MDNCGRQIGADIWRYVGYIYNNVTCLEVQDDTSSQTTNSYQVLSEWDQFVTKADLCCTILVLYNSCVVQFLAWTHPQCLENRSVANALRSRPHLEDVRPT